MAVTGLTMFLFGGMWSLRLGMRKSLEQFKWGLIALRKKISQISLPYTLSCDLLLWRVFDQVPHKVDCGQILCSRSGDLRAGSSPAKVIGYVFAVEQGGSTMSGVIMTGYCSHLDIRRYDCVSNWQGMDFMAIIYIKSTINAKFIKYLPKIYTWL